MAAGPSCSQSDHDEFVDRLVPIAPPNDDSVAAGSSSSAGVPLDEVSNGRYLAVCESARDLAYQVDCWCFFIFIGMFIVALVTKYFNLLTVL